MVGFKVQICHLQINRFIPKQHVLAINRQKDRQTMFVYSDHKKITKISQNTITDHKRSLETHIKAIAAIIRATNSIILRFRPVVQCQMSHKYNVRYHINTMSDVTQIQCQISHIVRQTRQVDIDRYIDSIYLSVDLSVYLSISLPFHLEIID